MYGTGYAVSGMTRGKVSMEQDPWVEKFKEEALPGIIRQFRPERVPNLRIPRPWHSQ
jgi:hypothetical protein